MNSNDFISADHILAEVLPTLDDADLRSGFSEGWYRSRIQDCLQELAYDTFYNKMTIDKKLPQGNLSLEMPNNAFNIREIHLYNGECCGPSTSQVVHWKRTFNNKGGGDGYTARIKDLGGKGDYDSFLPDHFNYDSTYEFSGTKYYANVQNGVIMFSTDCRAYTNVRITYNGLVGSVGSVPVIPRFFERVINDWIEERFYNAMKRRDPRRYRGLWQEAKNNLLDPRDGSIKKAKMRISQMDSWERESLEEYISSMYHK